MNEPRVSPEQLEIMLAHADEHESFVHLEDSRMLAAALRDLRDTRAQRDTAAIAKDEAVELLYRELERVRDAAEARCAALREALDGVRQWMRTIQTNCPPPPFHVGPMMNALTDSSAAAQAFVERVRAEEWRAISAEVRRVRAEERIATCEVIANLADAQAAWIRDHGPAMTLDPPGADPRAVAAEVSLNDFAQSLRRDAMDLRVLALGTPAETPEGETR